MSSEKSSIDIKKLVRNMSYEEFIRQKDKVFHKLLLDVIIVKKPNTKSNNLPKAIREFAINNFLENDIHHRNVLNSVYDMISSRMDRLPNETIIQRLKEFAIDATNLNKEYKKLFKNAPYTEIFPETSIEGIKNLAKDMDEGVLTGVSRRQTLTDYYLKVIDEWGIKEFFQGLRHVMPESVELRSFINSVDSYITLMKDLKEQGIIDDLNWDDYFYIEERSVWNSSTRGKKNKVVPNYKRMKDVTTFKEFEEVWNNWKKEFGIRYKEYINGKMDWVYAPENTLGSNEYMWFSGYGSSGSDMPWQQLDGYFKKAYNMTLSKKVNVIMDDWAAKNGYTDFDNLLGLIADLPPRQKWLAEQAQADAVKRVTREVDTLFNSYFNYDVRSDMSTQYFDNTTVAFKTGTGVKRTNPVRSNAELVYRKIKPTQTGEGISIFRSKSADAANPTGNIHAGTYNAALDRASFQYMGKNLYEMVEDIIKTAFVDGANEALDLANDGTNVIEKFTQDGLEFENTNYPDTFISEQIYTMPDGRERTIIIAVDITGDQLTINALDEDLEVAVEIYTTYLDEPLSEETKLLDVIDYIDRGYIDDGMSSRGRLNPIVEDTMTYVLGIDPSKGRGFNYEKGYVLQQITINPKANVVALPDSITVTSNGKSAVYSADEVQAVIDRGSAIASIDEIDFGENLGVLNIEGLSKEQKLKKLADFFNYRYVDVITYLNDVEDVGSISYLIINPAVVKVENVAPELNKTFDEDVSRTFFSNHPYETELTLSELGKSRNPSMSPERVKMLQEAKTPKPIKGARVRNTLRTMTDDGLSTYSSRVRDIASQYHADLGFAQPEFTAASIFNEQLGAYTATIFDNLPMFDEAALPFYEKFISETNSQFEYLLNGGLEVILTDVDPYTPNRAGHTQMIQDMQNGVIKVLATEAGFGNEATNANNPMLRKSKFKDANGRVMLENDVFRAVHDTFGHGMRGNTFGPMGEYNAWLAHKEMYSPDAKKVMTTETLGQNTWTNYGPHMRDADGNLLSKTDSGYLSPKDRPFSEQKVAIMPDEVIEAAGRVVTDVSELVDDSAMDKVIQLANNKPEVSNGLLNAAKKIVGKAFGATQVLDPGDVVITQGIARLLPRLGLGAIAAPALGAYMWYEFSVLMMDVAVALDKAAANQGLMQYGDNKDVDWKKLGKDTWQEMGSVSDDWSLSWKLSEPMFNYAFQEAAKLNVNTKDYTTVESTYYGTNY